MAKRRQIYGHPVVSPVHPQVRSRQRGKVTGWWLIAGIGIVLLVGGAWLLSRSVPALPAEISSMQAFEEYREGALFLDVRSEAEWNQGHIQDAVLIPLEQLAARLGELPRDRDIVVICKSGVRSREGAALLREAGFTRVTCLTGGLRSWIAAGYPLGD